MAKVTVITVVYNDEKNIESTIQSIISQTYPAIEYVVIDGGSTDNTKLILEKYSQHIDVLISERDNGIYDAMNKGIRLSSGQWIHFLNSADLYVDNKAIERMMSHVKRQVHVNIVYTKEVYNLDIKQQDLSYRYLSRKAMNHQSIIFSKQLFEKSLYDTTYEYFADYDHILRSVPIAKPLRVDIDFVKYDTDGVSSDIRNVNKIWRERARIIRSSDMPVYWRLPAVIHSYLAYVYRTIYKKV